jgi:cytochrome c-type biogenesis protein CcmE
MAAKKNRLYLIIAIVFGVGVTVALVLFALRSNIDLFYTPGEVIYGKGPNHEMPEIGRRLRIGGMVQSNSVVRDPNSLKVIFQVYDLRGVVTVEYEGILPDLFREEQSVIAQGELVNRDTIVATEILAKHDENYTPPEVSEAMKENHTRPDWAYTAEEKGNTAP